MTGLRIALSQTAIDILLQGIVGNVLFEMEGSLEGEPQVTVSDGGETQDLGGYRLDYDVAFYLEGGSLVLTDDGTFKLEELDVSWEKLQIRLVFDLPEICVGGGTFEFFGQTVEFEEYCVFGGEPDVDTTLELDESVNRSEISGEFTPEIVYFVHPDRPAEMDYLSAHDPSAAEPPIENPPDSLANQWRVTLNVMWLDIDPIDFPDRVGDALEDAVGESIEDELAPLPSWARSLVSSIIGSPGDLLRDILDTPDDFDEWLSDELNTSIGVMDQAATYLAERFGNEALLAFEDPLPVMKGTDTLIPVMVAVKNPAVAIDSSEMVIEAEIGEPEP